MSRLSLLGTEWRLHNRLFDESWLRVLPGTWLRVAHLCFNSMFTWDNFTQARIHRPDSFHAYIISTGTWKYCLKKDTGWKVGASSTSPGPQFPFQKAATIDITSFLSTLPLPNYTIMQTTFYILLFFFWHNNVSWEILLLCGSRFASLLQEEFSFPLCTYIYWKWLQPSLLTDLQFVSSSFITTKRHRISIPISVHERECL